MVSGKSSEVDVAIADEDVVGDDGRGICCCDANDDGAVCAANIDADEIARRDQSERFDHEKQNL